MDAIGLVIDVSQIEKRRECTVNEHNAFLCEIDDRSYLCWTLSPEISCVIEYSPEEISEDSVFRMAESVLMSYKEYPRLILSYQENRGI